MSLVLNNVAIDSRIVAIANAYLDLLAVKSHKIAADNFKARKALAGYARDKSAEVMKLMTAVNGFNDTKVQQLVNAVMSHIKADSAAAVRVKRERREAMQAEREALQAIYGLVTA